jgi:hypothetical protein
MFCRAPQNWPETSRIRTWMAVFCVLFLTLAGFVHVTGHASQPIPSGTVKITATLDNAAGDDQPQIDVEASHCHGCAVASMPYSPGIKTRTAMSATILGRPFYRAVQQRQHADPPPPRVLT